MSDNVHFFHKRALESIAEEVADSHTNPKMKPASHTKTPKKPTTFLSLPRELRQTILLYGFGAGILDFHQWRSEACTKWLSEPVYTWYDGCTSLLDRQHGSIKARARVLREVHAHIVDDVEYVEKQLGAGILDMYSIVLQDREVAPGYD